MKTTIAVSRNILLLVALFTIGVQPAYAQDIVTCVEHAEWCESCLWSDGCITTACVGGHIGIIKISCPG